MSDHANANVIVTVSDCRLRVLPDTDWAFARRHAGMIKAHWRRRSRDNPALFNGIVHLCAGSRVVGGVLEAEYLRTDFASYLYWREHACPDRSIRNAFGAALVRAADGALLLCRSGNQTINAGLVNPPGGFIDVRDVDAAGRIDIAANIARELAEETGLAYDDLVREPGFMLVFDGLLIAIGVAYRSPMPAAALAARVDRFIACEVDPELAGTVMVASRDAIGAHRMLGYTQSLVRALFPDQA